MKKSIFLAAAFAVLTLASCKKKETVENTNADTAVVVTDSSAMMMDSTAMSTPADSVSTVMPADSVK
ncbi:hypothetical protein [Chryseobacterium sp.]|uniref:hypothetical protein n=1 Tax=Chryseobacterium sp. TaxID=1871047 RepID=UPI0011CA6C78|nr:hypothetical protein [Chryseobacterium sp.]TXF76080.1 hypothetical protein FUA25_09300 [Chryseobacterium sp.]